MHTCIHAYMHTCIHAYIHTCIHAYMHTCIHAYMHTCIHAYIHAYMHTCTHAYIHTYMRTCTHAHMHTYIHAYIHTCIHTLFTYFWTQMQSECVVFGCDSYLRWCSYGIVSWVFWWYWTGARKPILLRYRLDLDCCNVGDHYQVDSGCTHLFRIAGMVSMASSWFLLWKRRHTSLSSSLFFLVASCRRRSKVWSLRLVSSMSSLLIGSPSSFRCISLWMRIYLVFYLFVIFWHVHSWYREGLDDTHIIYIYVCKFLYTFAYLYKLEFIACGNTYI